MLPLQEKGSLVVPMLESGPKSFCTCKRSNKMSMRSLTWRTIDTWNKGRRKGRASPSLWQLQCWQFWWIKGWCWLYPSQMIRGNGYKITSSILTCRINGQICMVMIDSRSSSNIVSQALGCLWLWVKQPWPNFIWWLMKGDEVKIQQRCHVSFSIGDDYNDCGAM